MFYSEKKSKNYRGKSPSSFVDEQLRNDMGEQAKRLASTIVMLALELLSL